MSLYLQAAIGASRYLLEAARVIELRAVAAPLDAALWQGRPVACVDMRALFGEDRTAPGYCVLFAQIAGEPAALLVDGIDGLVEVGDRELRPLPPIGPFGQLIDAVSTKLAQQRPMLRLRGERAVAAMPDRDIAAGADRG